MTVIIRLEEVESKTIEIRNHKVLLDSDVAQLYSVATREINQAVKNNSFTFLAKAAISFTDLGTIKMVSSPATVPKIPRSL